jgi:hypothetical protein
MSSKISLAFVIAAVASLGCTQSDMPTIDHGSVCVSSELVDGQYRISVVADSGDCSSDHEGASYECSVSVDGSEVDIETVHHDGKDPNSACAGPLMATCAVDVEQGQYTLSFGDETQPLVVPSAGSVCLGGE